MSKKKLYYISVTGESEGYTEKYLTEHEAELIKDIFEHTSSSEINCNIEAIPSIEEFENDFSSLLKPGTFSIIESYKKIADKYNILWETAFYLYSRYKNNLKNTSM